MNVLILSILVACASAQYYPGYYNYGYSTGFRNYNYNPYPYVPYTSTQYHSQDELGQATYGYAYPGQASTTTRDAFGNQAGSYAYYNAEGKEVRVSFVADHNGFRVLSNDLPVAPVDNGQGPAPVEDSADVAAAKVEFFKLFKEAAEAAAAAPETEEIAAEESATEIPADDDVPEGAAPVEYSPEVAAARAEFFKLYNEAAAAAAAAPEERKKRSLLAYPYPVLAKTTVKTVSFEKDEAAKTPAATTKIDLKEHEHDIITPLAYPAPLPIVYTPLVTKFAAVPAYTKATVKTVSFEKDEAAKTPAATTKIDLKEHEHDIFTPLAYPAPLPIVHTPLVTKFGAPQYAYQVVV